MEKRIIPFANKVETMMIVSKSKIETGYYTASEHEEYD